ncbi:MAG: DNA alkylation repair protein [Bacteroides sp.]|nr:DNA alkylation repair protein [Bacteroides sp.]MCM1379066.1 DNA alkylation repair protein [Bacteroides sp.]MCM1445764.1 DNA alkylation repair protein [Prevotella sp.]
MTLSEVRRQFFTFRNGLLADMLRKQAQLPQKVIFGLNLPQLREIAARCGQDDALACELWADTDCREARLLAPMIHSASAEVLAWLDQVITIEEADVVCHRLLRRCPGAADKARQALRSDNPLVCYAAIRLIINLLPDSRELALQALQTVEFHSLTDGIMRQLRRQLANEEEAL